MRGHKVEKPGFHFGVTESAEAGEFVFWDSHNLKAEDRCTQLPVVTDTAEPVGLTAPGIELEASAGLLGESTRAVMFGGEFEVPPLNLVVVLVEILDAEVRDRNPSGHNLEVISLGNFFPRSFPVTALVRRGARKARIELSFQFVIELDAENSAATALDLIADFVIEPIEIGIVKGFLGLL